jgi:hypothetical protein
VNNEFGIDHVLLICFIIIAVCILEVAMDPDEGLHKWIKARLSRRQFKKDLIENLKAYEPGDAVKALPGFEMNPFRKYPRNMTCYCESGKKYKNCCLLIEPLAIPKGEAEIARTLVSSLRKK